ncbi:hypothetical protein L1887_21236 [Cichorium endivia]|nr:hypothetical protein L1887_21236 [Cichorium endivia]
MTVRVWKIDENFKQFFEKSIPRSTTEEIDPQHRSCLKSADQIDPHQTDEFVSFTPSLDLNIPAFQTADQIAEGVPILGSYIIKALYFRGHFFCFW